VKIALLFLAAPVLLMAQTNQSMPERWLSKATISFPFVVPESKNGWENERTRIRTMLWQLLGKLPPRPKIRRLETLSRDDRGEFVVERFPSITKPAQP
jgi:hypothetical protein